MPITTPAPSANGQLFNAEESSMISQFFEKMNADPEFIFSPKLDEALLTLTERDFATPPPFTNPAGPSSDARNYTGPNYGAPNHHQPPRDQWNQEGGTYSTGHSFNNQFKPEFAPQGHGSFGYSFGQDNKQQLRPSTSQHAPPIGQQYQNFPPPPQSSSLLQHHMSENGSQSVPSNPRNHPILFGTDPSFQNGRFERNLPARASITEFGGGDIPQSTITVKNPHLPKNLAQDGAIKGVAMIHGGERREGFSPIAALHNLYSMQVARNESKKLELLNEAAANRAPIPQPPQQTVKQESSADSQPKINSTKSNKSVSPPVRAPASQTKSTPARPRRENLSEDQKRMNHISSEKRRRDLIKTQFKEMCSLVPRLSGDGKQEDGVAPINTQSKSVVLQVVYEYMVLMVEKNKRLRQYLEEQGAEGTQTIRDATLSTKQDAGDDN